MTTVRFQFCNQGHWPDLEIDSYLQGGWDMWSPDTPKRYRKSYNALTDLYFPEPGESKELFFVANPARIGWRLGSPQVRKVLYLERDARSCMPVRLDTVF